VTAINFALNGQSLVLFSSSATLYDTQAHADAGTNSITLPKQLAADVTYYTAKSAYKSTIVMQQLDGSEVFNQRLEMSAWQDALTVEPVATRFQLGADRPVADFWESNAFGIEESMPRDLAATGSANSTQVLRLRYFTCRKPGLVGYLTTAVGGTAAAATPSLCRVGLWTAGSDGALAALVAATPNDTALWAATQTKYKKAVSTPYQTVAGQRYAVGTLCVTAGTAPNLMGSAPSQAMLTETPRMAAQVNTQSDLPSSVLVGSLIATAIGPYVALEA
jgi:hypothetical protein